MNEPTNADTISVNYEAEWYIQREIIMELTSENESLKNTIIGMCKSLYVKGGVQE